MADGSGETDFGVRVCHSSGKRHLADYRTTRMEEESDGDRDTSKKSAGKNKTYIEIHSGGTITVTPE